MVRPCFLVIDREFPGSISTRKLVLETAKLNVITAYSAQEALETLRLFPNIHGVVLDTDVHDLPCEVLVAGLKELSPKLTIIAVSGPRQLVCPGADHHLESFDPGNLLEIIRNLNPVESEKIEKHEEELNRGLSKSASD